MSNINGIAAYSNSYQEYKHPTTGNKAPLLTVHHKLWTQTVTTNSGSYIQAEVWVSNDGQTMLRNINVTVTIQGGDGIWAPQFCDSAGNLQPGTFLPPFEMGDLQPGQSSAVHKYWWKAVKPNVPQNGADFDAQFTVIPDFQVVYADTDDYFTDKSHVKIG
ncbi:uncharacterized protein SOCEGT47_012730 [Sorangium cellulosum]|uniref:Uncharacterized protein n=1 Tax=Sorangium cellulosum TaxID=56 RepID=A0A4P2PVR0_SORCE|nr:hypothetical protein [Sorangium cellulosum]AUX20799.1 uncharacterized protein SOCEGT47_012730 [Sorangium cellulosum]